MMMMMIIIARTEYFYVNEQTGQSGLNFGHLHHLQTKRNTDRHHIHISIVTFPRNIPSLLSSIVHSYPHAVQVYCLSCAVNGLRL